MRRKKIFSLRITTVTVARHRVNLVYITAGEKSHCGIGETLEQTGIETI